MRALAVLALVGMLAGCWGPEGGPGGPGRSPMSPATSQAPAVAAVAGADGVQRVTVRMTDELTFVPAHVRARTGILEFTFRNTGVTPHDATVAGTDVGNLNGGATRVVRITVSRPGHYPFPCTYHEASGMTGNLDVTA